LNQYFSRRDDPAQRHECGELCAAEEVHVKLVKEWGDYVFAPDYQLKSLSEVEGFICTHHHLPGIPSAAEVETAGVSLGEMRAKLLLKIEELTLYVIEQQRTIETLQHQLKAVGQSHGRQTSTGHRQRIGAHRATEERPMKNTLVSVAVAALFALAGFPTRGEAALVAQRIILPDHPVRSTDRSALSDPGPEARGVRTGHPQVRPSRLDRSGFSEGGI